MRSLFAPLAPLALCLVAACSSSDGDGTPQTETAQLEAFNTVQESYFKAVDLAHAKACDVVLTASYDLSHSVTTATGVTEALVERMRDAGALSDEDKSREAFSEFTGDFDDALAEAVLTRRKALVSAYEMLEAMTPLEIGAGEGKSTAALSVPGGARIGKRESPLVFVALGALVGAVLLNKALHETMDSATDTRSKPLTDKIENANSAELEVIKEELGVESSASREETLKELKKRPAHKRLEAVKKAEAGLVVASFEEAEVEMVDQAEIMESISKAAVKCGETAATQVAGFWATGAGGQGVAQVMEAIGAGAVVANVVDMAVSVAGVAPLDLFAKVVSKAKKKQTIIPAPSSDPDLELPVIETAKEAIAVLKDTEAPADKVAAAANKVGEEMMEMGKVPGTTEADGSITAELPERTFVDKVFNPSATTMVKVPDMGPADILVSASERVPQLFEDVDTGATPAPTLDFDNETIEQFVEQLNPTPDGGGNDNPDGGTGGPAGKLLIAFPLQNLQINEEFTIKVHCAEGTAFPANLDVTHPTSASAVWGSRSTSCPIEVIYSNSTTGAQSLSFKLTDADGKITTATASPVLFDGDAKCDQSAWTACADTYDGPARETCIPSCDGSYNKETELRPYEICYMSCEVQSGNYSCACGAAAGCAGTKSCCMTACTTDYVSCLRGLTSDNLSDVAACRPDYFKCVNQGCF